MVRVTWRSTSEHAYSRHELRCTKISDEHLSLTGGSNLRDVIVGGLAILIEYLESTG
jgi:hypothetical protein